MEEQTAMTEIGHPTPCLPALWVRLLVWPSANPKRWRRCWRWLEGRQAVATKTCRQTSYLDLYQIAFEARAALIT
jgi:hypothetical protein